MQNIIRTSPGGFTPWGMSPLEAWVKAGSEFLRPWMYWITRLVLLSTTILSIVFYLALAPLVEKNDLLESQVASLREGLPKLKAKADQADRLKAALAAEIEAKKRIAALHGIELGKRQQAERDLATALSKLTAESSTAATKKAPARRPRS